MRFMAWMFSDARLKLTFRSLFFHSFGMDEPTNPTPEPTPTPEPSHEELRTAVLVKKGKSLKARTIDWEKDLPPEPPHWDPAWDQWAKDRHAAKERARKVLKHPAPATKAEVKKNMEALVKQTALAVVAENPPVKAPLVQGMTAQTKANVLAILGPDIDAARALFSDRMLVVASKVLDRIEREIEDIPHASLGFNLSVLTDKSEVLRSKNAVSAKGAQVTQQINCFGDGIDREKLIATLLGKFTPDPVQEAKPVTEV